MEGLLLVSLIAGVLTVAAPCVLPLLPIIVGSLAVSVILFTLLLKATTASLGIPPQV